MTCPRTGSGRARNDSQHAWGSLLYPRVTSPESRDISRPLETAHRDFPLYLSRLPVPSHPPVPVSSVSSPFPLAALSCELPHLAGSTSWLPARQLVTSFSLKLAWKSFHLRMTAAEHFVGHRTGRCHGVNRQTRKLLSESDAAANFGSLTLHLPEQFRCQMTDKHEWPDIMASRNEVVTPSTSVRDSIKANDGTAHFQCHLGITSLAISYQQSELPFEAPSPAFNWERLWQYWTGWHHLHVHPEKAPELPSYSPSRGEPRRMHLPKQSGHVLSETCKHPVNQKPRSAACSRTTCPTWPFYLLLQDERM